MPYADPLRRAEYLREWRVRNPGKNAAYVHRYYQTHLEQQRAARREYNRAHPEVFRCKYARRKLQIGATEEPGMRDFIRRLRSAAVWCHICWRPLRGSDTHIDHIVPLSRGGGHARANIAPICRSCNSRKHTRLLSEMAAEDFRIWHETPRPRE